MKVNICGYEVSISAKHPWQDKKSKTATLELLNYLSMQLDNSAYYDKSRGYDSLAKTNERYADELYKICDENNLYNETRK